jgi:hypothetical protein
LRPAFALQVETADNHFNLLPAEPVTVRTKSSALMEQVKAALTTMSLTDSFHPN